MKNGFSLVSVLVAMGLAGILAYFLNQMFSDNQRATRHLQDRYDKIIIGRTLLGQIDCANSFSSTTCPSSGLLALYGVNKQIVVANSGDPTKIGKFALRAECNSANNGIIVRAALLKPNATLLATNTTSFFPDSLTKKTYTWADNETLVFPEGANICPSEPVNNKRTWVDVNSSRSLNTDYVNDTGREIQVSVATYSGNTFKRCQVGILVDGVKVDFNFVNDSIGAALCSSMATVPAGSTYKADPTMVPPASAGENTLAFWSELR